MGLRPGREEIGRGMKIETVLAKRFAVVGQEEDTGNQILARRQHVDCRGNHVVGKADGVVIGIDDLLRRAAANSGVWQAGLNTSASGG